MPNEPRFERSIDGHHTQPASTLSRPERIRRYLTQEETRWNAPFGAVIASVVVLMIIEKTGVDGIANTAAQVLDSTLSKITELDRRE